MTDGRGAAPMMHSVIAKAPAMVVCASQTPTPKPETLQCIWTSVNGSCPELFMPSLAVASKQLMRNSRSGALSRIQLRKRPYCRSACLAISPRLDIFASASSVESLKLICSHIMLARVKEAVPNGCLSCGPLF